MFLRRALARSSPAEGVSIRVGKAPTVLSRTLASRDSGPSPLYQSGVCSVQGRKSEDRIIYGERVFKNVRMYAVIDGHGGASAADFLQEALPRVVSTMCRERFRQLATLAEDPKQYEDLLARAFKVCANEWDTTAMAAGSSEVLKMAGAVATVVLVQDRTCLIAHVGDGRVVAATNIAHAELTDEHRASKPKERERIESRGGRVLSGRVKGVLSPSRAFGDIHVRTLPTGEIIDCIAPEPDLSYFEVDLEGFLIVSTDGVNDAVSAREAADLVRERLNRDKDANGAASDLAHLASERNDDDISIIILTWA